MDSTIACQIAVRMSQVFGGWTHQLNRPKTPTQA